MRIRVLIALALITPVGLATKIYDGPAAWWVRDYLGGVLYVVFWILAVLWIRPGWSPRRVAPGVLLVTCALEFLQLWHPPFLEAIRSAAVGRALIGTTFVWWDLPHYVVGAVLGAVLGSRLASAGRAA